MGLDMYLNKRVFIGANYEYRKVKGNINITMGEDDTPININFNKLYSTEEEIGYWRKANHIHNWFVENVQSGNDDCDTYSVSLEDLKELLNVCNKILEDSSLAEELLPRTQGFFFGSIEYDEYYYDSIRYTISVLKEAIEGFIPGITTYYYRSSW